MSQKIFVAVFVPVLIIASLLESVSTSDITYETEAYARHCSNLYEPKLNFCTKLEIQYNPNHDRRYASKCQIECQDGTKRDECGNGELKRNTDLMVEDGDTDGFTYDPSYISMEEADRLLDYYSDKLNFVNYEFDSDSKDPQHTSTDRRNLLTRSPRSDCLANCNAISNYRGGIINPQKLLAAAGRGAVVGACIAYCNCLPN